MSFILIISRFLPPGLTHAASISWTGTAGDGLWETANNWNGNAVPTASDDVTISGTVTTTLSNGQTANFNSLTIGDGTNAAAVILTGNIGTGGSITLANRGTLIQNNATQQIITGTITIQSGGVLKHGANSTSQSYVVNLKAAAIDVQSGGSVNVDGLGYTAGASATSGNGTGPGLKEKGTAGGGGGHGGNGAHGGSGGTTESGGGTGGSGGIAYCDITDVATIGSGGAGASAAASTGNGGGLIILEATGTATIGGTLSAKGSASTGTASGGGAGGGIKLTAGTINGAPTSINISGGAGQGNASGGGGGGGCMLVIYTTSNTITNDLVTMNGGGTASQNVGGAGQLHIKQTGSNGTLAVVNSVFASASTTQVASSPTFASLTVTKANYYVGSVKTLTLSPTSTDALGGSGGNGLVTVHGTLTLNGSDINAAKVILTSGSTFNNSATLNISSSGGLIVPSGATLATAVGTLTATGTLELDSGATFTVSNLAIAGSTTTLNNYSLTTPLNLNGSFTMSGGSMTNATNTAAQTHIVYVSSTNITVGSTSAINATGKAYSTSGSGPGPGSGTANGQPSGGGAHGGNGGTQNSGTGGTAYCTVTDIQTMGSPGWSPVAGQGIGGGLIYLKSAATTTIQGVLASNGREGNAGGGGSRSGGAGGGIRIHAQAITGSPIGITADGGARGGVNAAGGGGGCIQMTYRKTNTITATSSIITVNGGAGGTTAAQAGLFSAASNNTLPTTTAFTASQVSSQTVFFKVTIADGNRDETSLIVEHSTDGLTWTSSTLQNVEVNIGSISTSTGLISHIYTNSATTTVKGIWQIATDLPDANNTSVLLRMIPYDGIANGVANTSTGFSSVTQLPGGLAIKGTTNNTATIEWATSSAFSEYYIEDVSKPEFNSGWISDKTYVIKGLACATPYSFRLQAKTSGNFITSSTALLRLKTSACSDEETIRRGGGSSDSGPGSGTSGPGSGSGETGSPTGPTTFFSGPTIGNVSPGEAPTALSPQSPTFSGSKEGSFGSRAGGAFGSAPGAASGQTPEAITFRGSDGAVPTLSALTAFSAPLAALAGPLTISKPSFLQMVTRDTFFAPTPGDASQSQNETAPGASPENAPPGPPAPPSAETIAAQTIAILESISAAAQSIAPTVGESQNISVGSESHSLTVSTASAVQITFTLRSEPQTLTLAVGERQLVDSNKDGIDDMLVEYKGLVDGNPVLTMAPLIDTSETTAPFTLNNGALMTDSPDVILTFQASTSTQKIEVSGNASFASSTVFAPTTTLAWRLGGSEGAQTVYARLWKDDGTITEYSSSIFLTPNGINTVLGIGGREQLSSRPPITRSFSYRLMRGDAGNYVRRLQLILQFAGYFTSPIVTDYFGPKTEIAVRALQRAYHLPAVGEVGARTNRILNVLLEEYQKQN